MKSCKIQKNTQTALCVLTAIIVAVSFLPLGVNAEDVSYPLDASFISDREFLSKVIEKTAPEASYVARLALGALILNRVKDDRFPSSIRAVVYQNGEFECASDPDLEETRVSYLSSIAARDALLGFDVSCGALYFRRGKASERSGSCLYHSGFIFYKSRDDIPPKYR